MGHEEILQSVRAPLSQRVLYEAFRDTCRRNKGAAGIDGQSLNASKRTWRWSCSCLLSELKEEAALPRSTGTPSDSANRTEANAAGHPTVSGPRMQAKALRTLLEPIFDGDFHRSSYGYRPGPAPIRRSAKRKLFIPPLPRPVVDMGPGQNAATRWTMPDPGAVPA